MWSQNFKRKFCILPLEYFKKNLSTTGHRSRSASWLRPCLVSSRRREDAGSAAEGLEDNEDKGEDHNDAGECCDALDEDEAGGEKGKEKDLAKPKKTGMAKNPKGVEGSAKEAEVRRKPLGVTVGNWGMLMILPSRTF